MLFKLLIQHALYSEHVPNQNSFKMITKNNYGRMNSISSHQKLLSNVDMFRNT